MAQQVGTIRFELPQRHTSFLRGSNSRSVFPLGAPIESALGGLADLSAVGRAGQRYIRFRAVYMIDTGAACRISSFAADIADS